MIIYFFGPDGSGKTTLARLLIYELRRSGIRVKYSWMKGSHTFASLLSRFLSRFTCFRGWLNPWYGINIPKRMIKLWCFLEYMSALPIILLKYVFPSFLGYIVVADRYVLDLVVWVALITSDNNVFLRSLFGRHLISLALRCKHRFFVVTDLRDLIERGGGETAFLKIQLHTYRSLNIDSYTIDTTRKRPKESFKEILGVLYDYSFKRS